MNLDPISPREDGFTADRERFDRWVQDLALPLWATAGIDPTLGFREALDQDGRPPHLPLRVRVQVRQVYAFATAGVQGWPGPWRGAVEHGLAFIRARYRRPDGLVRSRLDPTGAPDDETAVLYDQAFLLLALAAAAEATPGQAEALEAEAAACLASLRADRAHGAGGFVEAGEAPYQSNPHMHLLEAALAWAELNGHARWDTLADELAALCLDRFVDPATGAVREFFDAGWRPAAGAAGRRIEPGHQFEWGWLLQRWGRRRSSPRAEEAAARLYSVGRRGVDAANEVVLNALDDTFAVADGGTRLWPQTEWLKAALAFDRGDAGAALRAVLRSLESPTPGLWQERMSVGGEPEPAPAPATSLYHLVCAWAELRKASAVR